MNVKSQTAIFESLPWKMKMITLPQLQCVVIMML